MPFVLSWCVADKQLILSLSPQNIRAFPSAIGRPVRWPMCRPWRKN